MLAADPGFGATAAGELSSQTYYLSLAGNATLRSSDGSTLAVADADIFALNVPASGGFQFLPFFDGSDVGLATDNEDIDAFDLLPDGSIVVSTVGSFSVSATYTSPGVGTGATLSGSNRDLLKFTPAAVGDNTTGSWSLFLSGTAVGLDSSDENIDSIAVLADGRLVISTAGSSSVPGGVAGKDEDLLALTPSTGAWELYFDGSDVGLDSSSEDIDGLHLEPSPTGGNPALLVTTRDNFSVQGLSGTDEDIFRFIPNHLGATTEGTYGPVLALDGSAYGLSGDIDGIHIRAPTPEEPPPPPPDAELPLPLTVQQADDIRRAFGPLADLSQFLHIKQFNARGNGLTDDYAALRLASAAMSLAESAGKTLYFSPGVYRIDQVGDRSTGDAPGSKDIRFVGAQNIKIIGDGAVIDVKGNFHKQAYAPLDNGRTPPMWHSDLEQITPFAFIDSSGFTLSGFEIRGNVERMTRETSKDGQAINVIERGGHGVRTSGSSDYTLANLTIVGFSTDGLILGEHRGDAVDRNATVINVTSQRNARQGLSIIQLYGGTFTNSKFLDTGRTGAYGGHEPMAGVDVEPIHAAPVVPVNTGDLVFAGCVFSGNVGSQFQAGWGAIGAITIDRATIEASGDSSNYAVVLSTTSGVLKNSTIDTRTGAIWTAWPQHPDATGDINTTLSGNTIFTTGNGIVAKFAGATLLVDGNTIKGKYTSRAQYYMPHLSAGDITFKNNRVFIPKAAFDPKQTSGHLIAYLVGVTLSSRNTFETDLRTSGARFTVQYGAATKVDRDTYDRAPFIAPRGVASWSSPYSKNPS